jgi:hypothetical protein
MLVLNKMNPIWTEQNLLKQFCFATDGTDSECNLRDTVTSPFTEWYLLHW